MTRTAVALALMLGGLAGFIAGSLATMTLMEKREGKP